MFTPYARISIKSGISCPPSHKNSDTPENPAELGRGHAGSLEQSTQALQHVGQLYRRGLDRTRDVWAGLRSGFYTSEQNLGAFRGFDQDSHLQPEQVRSVLSRTSSLLEALQSIVPGAS